MLRTLMTGSERRFEEHRREAVARALGHPDQASVAVGLHFHHDGGGAEGARLRRELHHPRRVGVNDAGAVGDAERPDADPVLEGGSDRGPAGVRLDDLARSDDPVLVALGIGKHVEDTLRRHVHMAGHCRDASAGTPAVAPANERLRWLSGGR